LLFSGCGVGVELAAGAAVEAEAERV